MIKAIQHNDTNAIIYSERREIATTDSEVASSSEPALAPDSCKTRTRCGITCFPQERHVREPFQQLK